MVWRSWIIALGVLLACKLFNCLVGVDGIPYAAFQVDATWWRSALLDLFELVRDWGVVPATWKQSFVIPVFKRGSRRDPDNYRPISLACCLFKIFERLLHQRVEPVVSPLLDNSQAGYRCFIEDAHHIPTFCNLRSAS